MSSNYGDKAVVPFDFKSAIIFRNDEFEQKSSISFYCRFSPFGFLAGTVGSNVSSTGAGVHSTRLGVGANDRTGVGRAVTGARVGARDGGDTCTSKSSKIGGGDEGDCVDCMVGVRVGRKVGRLLGGATGRVTSRNEGMAVGTMVSFNAEGNVVSPRDGDSDGGRTLKRLSGRSMGTAGKLPPSSCSRAALAEVAVGTSSS